MIQMSFLTLNASGFKLANTVAVVQADLGNVLQLHHELGF